MALALLEWHIAASQLIWFRKLMYIDTLEVHITRRFGENKETGSALKSCVVFAAYDCKAQNDSNKFEMNSLL